MRARRGRADSSPTELHRCAQLCLGATACDAFFYRDSDDRCVFFPNVAAKATLWTRVTAATAGQDDLDWSAFVLVCSEDTESLLPRWVVAPPNQYR